MNPMQKHIESVKEALPATTRELVAVTGLSRSHVSKTLTIMRCMQSVHISAYTKTKEANAPIYAYGAGDDAPYPKKVIRVREPKPKPVKEPRLPFALPKRCEPKIKVAIPTSQYRTVWQKTPTPQSANL